MDMQAPSNASPNVTLVLPVKGLRDCSIQAWASHLSQQYGEYDSPCLGKPSSDSCMVVWGCNHMLGHAWYVHACPIHEPGTVCVLKDYRRLDIFAQNMGK